MEGNIERTPDPHPTPMEFQRAGLLADIRQETKHMRTARFMLEALLLETDRSYTDDLTGKPIVLPPGALLDTRTKMVMDRREVEPDVLTEILYEVCTRAGIHDARIVATTRGAWMSNETLDRLVAWNQQEQSQSQNGLKHAGANKFAHLFTLALNNRGSNLWMG